MPIVIVLALWLLLAPLAHASSPAALPQQTGLDLQVRIDYENKKIIGSATLELNNGSTINISRIPLLLNRLLQVQSVRLADGPTSRPERLN